jgi:chromosomal replication initiator protein
VRFSVVPQLFEAGAFSGGSVAGENAVGTLEARAGAPLSQPPPPRPRMESPPRNGAAALRAAPAAAAGAFSAISRTRLRHDVESFIVGPSNQLAYNAALYVAEFPGAQYNPLFIHSGCGLGKTHLLQGLCKRFQKHHPTKRWAYLTGEEFTNEFLTALRSNKLDGFRRRMRDLDLLAIDDVHFLLSWPATATPR